VLLLEMAANFTDVAGEVQILTASPGGDQEPGPEVGVGALAAVLGS